MARDRRVTWAGRCFVAAALLISAGCGGGSAGEVKAAAQESERGEVPARQVVPGRFMPGAEGSWAFVEVSGQVLFGVGGADPGDTGEMVDLVTGEVSVLPDLPERFEADDMVGVGSGVVVIGSDVDRVEDDGGFDAVFGRRAGYRFDVVEKKWVPLDMSQVQEEGRQRWGLLEVGGAGGAVGAFAADGGMMTLANLVDDAFVALGQMPVPTNGGMCATGTHWWQLEFADLPNPAAVEGQIQMGPVQGYVRSMNLETGKSMLEDGPDLRSDAGGGGNALACGRDSVGVLLSGDDGGLRVDVGGGWVVPEWAQSGMITGPEGLSGPNAMFSFGLRSNLKGEAVEVTAEQQAGHVVLRRGELLDVPRATGSRYKWFGEALLEFTVGESGSVVLAVVEVA